MQQGKLVLANGATFYGNLLGDITVGEVVFNTGMTGYQEIATDPSYAGQIVTLTYPLVGNYGCQRSVEQAPAPALSGLVVGELCTFPNNWENEGSFGAYLNRHKIPCLYGVDTRAITRAIRREGTLKGVIVPVNTPESEVQRLLIKELPHDQVMQVTVKEVQRRGAGEYHVAVYDFGAKENILRGLSEAGCALTIFPADAKASEVLAVNPDGVFLSNGPGDPKDLGFAVEEIKQLFGKVPVFGICMGHQLISLALGGDTYKMPFGHRGSNHPVKDVKKDRVYITSQNHGYAVDEKSLEGKPITVTHISMNDGTVEGIRHNEWPIMSVQYHPEASPGPTDNLYLFDEFVDLMKGASK